MLVLAAELAYGEAPQRDARSAVTHARRACELTQWKVWGHVRTLAHASAEAGDLDGAMQWATRAFELAPPDQRPIIRQQLLEYSRRAGTLPPP